jgi:hypothetical protein
MSLTLYDGRFLFMIKKRGWGEKESLFFEKGNWVDLFSEGRDVVGEEQWWGIPPTWRVNPPP